jgi:hypothetical protein
MRKIPEKYDNPLDNLFIIISELMSPYAYSLGMTPNFITTLSSISCIIAVTFLLNGYHYYCCLFLLISYYFDCMDGHMARKYNMVTVFGDYYDHISDIIKIIIVLTALYYINKYKFFRIIPFILLLAILMSVHFGCQELLYVSNESETLKITKRLCPVKNPKNTREVKNALTKTRYFGSGTFYIGLVLAVLYYKF